MNNYTSRQQFYRYYLTKCVKKVKKDKLICVFLYNHTLF